MKLKTKIAMLALGTAFVSYAQNADLDRFNISYRYVNLPTNPISDPILRHFSVTTNADMYDKSKILDNINLVGFKKREEDQDATIKIDVRIERLKVEEMDIRTEKSEKKDDKGNVIETKYTYYPYMNYVTRGSASFTNKSGESFNQRLGSSQKYTGNSHNSYGSAQNYLKNNYEILTQDFQNKFVASVPSEVQYYGNRLYGYPTYKDNILFWILGSKKNPEYKNCQEIINKIKEMIENIKANEPISEELKSQFSEVEKHFLDILPKYTDSKKAHRKMRYYSYYNLGRLYLIFDMPKKAIEMAEKLIQNDYDKSDGTRIKEEAEYLIKRMEINNIFTKHFPVEVVAE